MAETDSQTSDDSPRFRAALLHPRYWGKWLAAAVLSALCLLPWSALDAFGAWLGQLAFKRNAKHRRRAGINLEKCFPQMSPGEREALLQAHFVVYWQTLLQTPLLWWGSRRRLAARTEIVGEAHMEDARQRGAVIVLSCHSVALDFGAVSI